MIWCFPSCRTQKHSQMLTKWPKLKTFYCLIDVFKSTFLIYFSFLYFMAVLTFDFFVFAE